MGGPTIGYGNSSNFVLSDRHSLWSIPFRAISVIRGQNFGCGVAALGIRGFQYSDLAVFAARWHRRLRHVQPQIRKQIGARDQP